VSCFFPSFVPPSVSRTFSVFSFAYPLPRLPEGSRSESEARGRRGRGDSRSHSGRHPRPPYPLATRPSTTVQINPTRPAVQIDPTRATAQIDPTRATAQINPTRATAQIDPTRAAPFEVCRIVPRAPALTARWGLHTDCEMITGDMTNIGAVFTNPEAFVALQY